jgi:hypothetical protein
MITKDRIYSAVEALIYYGSCAAATCEECAERKSISHSAFERHVNIAKGMIENAERFNDPGKNLEDIVRVKERLNEAIQRYTVTFPKRNSIPYVSYSKPTPAVTS